MYLQYLTKFLIVGAGYTVEGQKSGEEKFGGLQIEITPAYNSRLKIWFRGSDPEPERFSYVGYLDVYTTPAANKMQVGDKLRMHSDPPTKDVSKTISDLLAELPSHDSHFMVHCPSCC